MNNDYRHFVKGLNRVALYRAAMKAAVVASEEKKMNKTEEMAMGLTAINIQPNQLVTLKVEAYVVYRPLRIWIDDTISPKLLIVDFRAGKNTLFVNSCPIPVRAFELFRYTFRIMQISERIELMVQNTGTKPHDFRAALIGVMIPPEEHSHCPVCQR